MKIGQRSFNQKRRAFTNDIRKTRYSHAKELYSQRLCVRAETMKLGKKHRLHNNMNVFNAIDL